MKKAFLLAFLVFSVYVIEAQTKEETLDFLKTYYSTIPIANRNFGDYKVTYDDGMNTDNYKECVIVSYVANGKRSIPILILGNDFKKITSISYSSKVENDGYAAWEFKITLKNNEGDDADNDVYTIYIPNSKSEAYLEKFKKALTRLATLNGAKIVSEDLF